MSSTLPQNASEKKLPLRCWKSLYMKLTSAKVRYHHKDIEAELSECSEHFKRGIFQFSSSVPSNHIELRENKTSNFMESFYQRLSKILYADIDTCKEIFANYMLHNCNNSGTLLQERLEKNVRAVLLSTWSFYAQERIFFLKCYYHIICSSLDENAPYHDIFKKFAAKMSHRERHSSLLKQYKTLIHLELPSVNSFSTLADMLNPLWITYNLREQLEILQLIILVTSQIDVTLNDIDELIELLQITSFGRYQCFFYHHSHLSANQHALQEQIHHVITLYTIQVLSIGWKEDIYKDASSKFVLHNKIMYPAEYDMKQGPIVIAWILVLYHRLMNCSTYDEQLSNQSFILLDEDLWKVLADALESNVMDMPVICDVLEPILDEMVYSMFTKFGICAFKSQFTLSSILSFFCKQHVSPLNKSTTALLNHFKERFPLNCASTFKIFGAILNWGTDITQRKELVESLNHLPFNVKKDDCSLKTVELNKYVLEHNIKPLKFSQSNIIPQGTVAIPDFEDNIVTLKKSLPIWDVMRNFLTMYLNGYDDNDLITTIIEIVNFVEISLQKIRSIDDDILRFSELVVQVIWKTSSSCNSQEEMNILAACIKLHSVLFCIMPEDIIKCFEIYNFLPGYPVRMKRRGIQLHDTYYTESRIYTIVCCKEAKAGTFSVLFSYLNFFHNVVQNMLNSWYTVAGLKFVLHVYNNVNNDFWKFKNLDDRNLIIWKCIEIIHEILNHGLKDLFNANNADELIDFREDENENVLPTTYFITKSCVSSILNSVNESTILSTAITGDIGLLESLIENACWTKGKSAVMINIITYSLSLIQRCLIFVDVEKKYKKTEWSFDHLFQPDKCLALLSYRYNCFSETICLLAIKLLIKLASMKENCMFSWLQYSNELLHKEFLYPLFSSNESNAVKSSLLALMAVCILKQIVIADALLEIDKVRKICVEKSTPDKKWRNLLLFTSHYLHDIEKKPENYLSNMHCAVLNVIYACWEKKLKVPQQYYKMSPEFWKFLLAPLRKDPRDSFRGYGFILETVCLEIAHSKNIEDNLKSELDAFLNSEYFPKWTEFCVNVIDEPASLSVEFEIIPIPTSTVAASWKKFIQVVTRHCDELIKNPGKTAFPIFESLTEQLSTSEGSEKEKLLCDIYRIYLSTWKSECSETNWRDELLLTSKMFIVLNEYHFRYTPYFYSALLEVGYKILKFGKEHINVLNELKDKPDFLLACGGIMIQKLSAFGKLLAEKNEPCIEYPPLLLHLCIFTDVINGLDISTELITFILRETDFVNFILKSSYDVLRINSGTKTAKMLLQFQNFVFEKYPFLKKNYYTNESVLNIFQSVFPSEIITDQQKLLNILNENEKNSLFRFGLNFVSNLTNEPTCESKTLLIEFHSKNKQYLYAILNMINVNLKKENLYLATAVATFYFRISQHLLYCKFSEINDLVESMFMLFNCVKSAISILIQPSKMCSLLLNVPLHHLQQYFEDADNVKNISTDVTDTHQKLTYLVKIGIQTLSAFCIHGDSTLCGTWPPEDWNFRWLGKIKSKADCSFPLLLLDMDNIHDDFTVLSAFVTLEHRAYTKRMKIENPSSENLVGNRLTILSHDKSGKTLLDLSHFLFSQSAMYLLHPQVDQSKKLFFVNHIFVNLKEFIRNAIHDSLTEDVNLPSATEDYETFRKRPRLYSQTEMEIENEKSEDKLPVSNVTPMPTRQVLSLRGNDAKIGSKSTTSDSDKGNEPPIQGEDDEKIQTVALQTVAALFYKLITTFKHS